MREVHTESSLGFAKAQNGWHMDVAEIFLVTVLYLYLWEACQLKVLLECWIVSKVLEVECLLRAPELLGLLLYRLLLLL